MNFVKSLLNSKEIKARYRQCKKTNHYRARHDITHAKRCVHYAEQVLDLLKMSERDKVLIETCLVFHDIMQVGERFKHEKRSADYAIDFLKPLGVFSEDELKIIHSAIMTHDEFSDYSVFENDIAWYVNFIDKLDHSRKRLVFRANKKFGYSVYADIKKIDFKFENGTLKIIERTIKNPKFISERTLFRENVFTKCMKIFVCLGKHFGFKTEVYLDDKKLDLKNINESVMGDDGKKAKK